MTLRDARETMPKTELINVMGTDNIIGKNWTALTANDILHYDVANFMVTMKPVSRGISPWEESDVDMNITRLPSKKTEVPPYELKAQFLGLIQEMAIKHDIIDQIYCDGSLNTDTGRAGAAITILSGGHYCSDHDKQIRLQDWASSTQSELLAILVGLGQVEERQNNSIVISDSMAALQSINSKNAQNVSLVQRIRKKVKKIKENGISLFFVWVPSHVDIAGNERADKLAKLAALKESVDYNVGLSLRQARSKIRDQQRHENLTSRQIEYGLSRSTQYYDMVAQQTTFTYGRRCVSRHVEVTHARIRLGYYYPWQFTNNVSDDKKKCNVCNQENSHTLYHYIMECVPLAQYRSVNLTSLTDQAKFMLMEGKITEILKKFSGFASPR